MRAPNIKPNIFAIILIKMSKAKLLQTKLNKALGLYYTDSFPKKDAPKFE